MVLETGVVVLLLEASLWSNHAAGERTLCSKQCHTISPRCSFGGKRQGAEDKCFMELSLNATQEPITAEEFYHCCVPRKEH